MEKVIINNRMTLTHCVYSMAELIYMHYRKINLFSKTFVSGMLMA